MTNGYSLFLAARQLRQRLASCKPRPPPKPNKTMPTKALLPNPPAKASNPIDWPSHKPNWAPATNPTASEMPINNAESFIAIQVRVEAPIVHTLCKKSQLRLGWNPTPCEGLDADSLQLDPATALFRACCNDGQGHAVRAGTGTAWQCLRLTRYGLAFRARATLDRPCEY